jgi:hypothetical protein
MNYHMKQNLDRLRKSFKIGIIGFGFPVEKPPICAGMTKADSVALEFAQRVSSTATDSDYTR